MNRVDKRTTGGLHIVLGIALFVLITGLFSLACRNAFVNFGDIEQVTRNGQVQGGVRDYTIRWAFSNFQAGTWQPLAWISHMADFELWKLNPAGHHFTSALLHGLNALLVFLLLRKLTGSIWLSLMAAMLFAVHPLRVESVVWVSERSGLLATVLGLLSLWFYLLYVGTDEEGEEPSATIPAGHFILSLVFYVMSLLSGPALVSLPLVMLLLDYWPLKRFEKARRRRSSRAERKAIIVEKVPFIILATGAFIIGICANTTGSLGWTGMGRALSSLPWCLGKSFWPVNLSVIYVVPGRGLVWWMVGAGILAAGCFGAICIRKKQPSLFVGWFWWVGALMPAAFLIQSYGRFVPDSLAYFPSVGLAILLVWSGYFIAQRWKMASTPMNVAAMAGLGLCVWQSTRQIAVWRDGGTLFEHALAVTRNNAVAENGLGAFFLGKEEWTGAESHLREAVKIQPNYAEAWDNLGHALLGQKKAVDAEGAFKMAMRVDPRFAPACNSMGNLYVTEGKLTEALPMFQKAVELKPDYSEARYNLGQAYFRQKRLVEAEQELGMACVLSPGNLNPEYHFAHGNVLVAMNRMNEAILPFRQAIKLKPDYVQAHNNLGNALFVLERKEEAMREYEETIRLDPRHPGAHLNLGIAIAETGKWDEAIMHYESALIIDPNFAPAKVSRALAYIRKGWPDDAVSEMQEVLKANPDFADAHYAMGMALKAKLRLEEANQEFKETLRINPGYKKAEEGLADIKRLSR